MLPNSDYLSSVCNGFFMNTRKKDIPAEHGHRLDLIVLLSSIFMSYRQILVAGKRLHRHLHFFA